MTTVNPGVRQMRLEAMKLSVKLRGFVDHVWIDQQIAYLKTGKHPPAQEPLPTLDAVAASFDEPMSRPDFRYYSAPEPVLPPDQISDLIVGTIYE